MCYSEELKREAGGFHVDGEWVLTGWKGMHKAEGDFWLYDRVEERKSIQVMNKNTGYQWKVVELPPETRWVPRKASRYVSSFDPKYVYEFGKVMTDHHGFHLAATKKGAKNAVSGSNAVYTKILAKESSIESNHAHIVMILEPGQEPTEDQIRAVALAKYDMSEVDRDEDNDGVYTNPAVVAPATYWINSAGTALPGNVTYSKGPGSTIYGGAQIAYSPSITWAHTSGTYSP